MEILRSRVPLTRLYVRQGDSSGSPGSALAHAQTRRAAGRGAVCRGSRYCMDGLAVHAPERSARQVPSHLRISASPRSEAGRRGGEGRGEGGGDSFPGLPTSGVSVSSQSPDLGRWGDLATRAPVGWGCIGSVSLRQRKRLPRRGGAICLRCRRGALRPRVQAGRRAMPVPSVPPYGLGYFFVSSSPVRES